jgi:hypothetical protein
VKVFVVDSEATLVGVTGCVASFNGCNAIENVSRRRITLFRKRPSKRHGCPFSASCGEGRARAQKKWAADEPWVSDATTYSLQTPRPLDGEVLEMIFAPIDEDPFNARIRDPAAGLSSP